MYAIIKAGGKQYKVEAGDKVRVERLSRGLGTEFNLDDILCVGGEKTFLGTPNLDGAKVTVVVTEQSKANKIIVFKKKRRQGYRRMQGHRQLYTELFIKTITSPEGNVSSADSEPVIIDPKKKEERLKKLAEAKAEAKKAGVKKKVVKKKAPAKKKVAKKKVAKKSKVVKKKAKKKVAKKVAKKKTK